MELTLHDQSLTLLPEKALRVDDALVLSDTHFGKAAAFRAKGIPVPEGDTADDLARIQALVAAHRPARLVIAGDFLHAPEGRSPEILDLLATFLRDLPCEAHLVLGNHDQRAGRLPADWPILVHRRLTLGPFTVLHDPADIPPGVTALCGHLHPVARIRDGRTTTLRLPCFWLRRDALILPSFGAFTGGAVVQPAAGDRIFVPLAERVTEIPAALLTGQRTRSKEKG